MKKLSHIFIFALWFYASNLALAINTSEPGNTSTSAQMTKQSDDSSELFRYANESDVFHLYAAVPPIDWSGIYTDGKINLIVAEYLGYFSGYIDLQGKRYVVQGRQQDKQLSLDIHTDTGILEASLIQELDQYLLKIEGKAFRYLLERVTNDAN